MHRFPDRLRQRRKEKGLEQAALGRLVGKECHAAGKVVSDWETGGSFPRVRTLVLLCLVLDVTPNYLLGFSDEKL